MAFLPGCGSIYCVPGTDDPWKNLQATLTETLEHKLLSEGRYASLVDTTDNYHIYKVFVWIRHRDCDGTSHTYVRASFCSMGAELVRQNARTRTHGREQNDFCGAHAKRLPPTMTKVHGLAASIRAAQESETFDLAGQNVTTITKTIETAFQEPFSVENKEGMIRLTFVVGAGKASRQNYNAGAAKAVTSSLIRCGYEEDRGASSVAECGGSFKTQHDTGKLKVVVPG